MNRKSVVILDYQLGNLFSVKQACNRVGFNAKVSSLKEDIASADGIILPGVGAFQEAMKNMANLDLVSPLQDFVLAGKPLFGICLGLQLLFTESEEFGRSKGLGLVDGTIRKFMSHGPLNSLIKVPQIGWNHVYKKLESWEKTPIAHVENNSYFYFVHSYYAHPDQPENRLTASNYGGFEYTSAIIKRPNIFATQFHPEKSGEKGLSIYDAWGKQHNLI